MESKFKELDIKGRAAKEASHRMAFLPTEIKNRALLALSDALIKEQGKILAANEKDIVAAKQSGMGAAMIDRLLLNESRLKGMAADIRVVAGLPDPVGEIFDARVLPNGLQISRRRVPLGVIGVIYESRPNVTVDIFSLCLKSGNAVVLRGGREAVNSNIALASLAREKAVAAGVPEGAVQLIESTDRDMVHHMLGMRQVIDLMIPRGGAELVKFVKAKACMPVVAGGVGVCHTYIDAAADLRKAVAIVYNAKVQRPTVCNALDTILVHRSIAGKYLPMIAAEFIKAGVEMHCDARALAVLKGTAGLKLAPATRQDWGREYLALICGVRTVDSLDGALEHITKYGSGHSEAIVTEDYSVAMRFANEVDAAAVYVNASTRFTDGGQFGLGAEVGISTQKFHARGPLGLRELTSYKWVVLGNGQVRP